MDVYLLGAGFSLAASADSSVHMPLTSELADLVDEALAKRLAILRGPSLDVWSAGEADDELKAIIRSLRDRLGHDVEKWLSVLGGGGPWLERSESLRFQSAYFRISDALRVVLAKREQVIAADWFSSGAQQQGTCPPWLAQLVERMRATSATVISLNYDTLLERAACQLAFGGEKFAEQRLYPAPMQSVFARRGSTPVVARDLPEINFDVLKLHGSLNWLRDPTDRVGITPTYIWPFPSNGDVGFEIKDPREHPVSDLGLAPLIVPPSSNKSSFFEDQLLRLQWQHASRALGRAERVVVMGCALREADVELLQLLQLSTSETASVHVADPSSDAGARAEQVFRRSVSWHSSVEEAVAVLHDG